MVRFRIATMLGAAFGGVFCAAYGQHVVSASGDNVVLSAGSEAGVRKSMSGRLCAPELVGNRIVPNCYARFVVVSVSAKQAVARITKGVASEVRSGVLAEFDEKLKPPPREPQKTSSGNSKREPARPDGSKLLREANRAFDEGDYRGAVERYENYLRAYPDGTGVDEAKSRISESRAREAEMLTAPPATVLPVAPPPPVIPAALLQADQLAATAEEFFATGKFGDARNAAISALKSDSTNARALAALSAIRTKTVQSRFRSPAGVAVGPGGECYVADSGNNTIRRIAQGVAVTIAGAAGEFGEADGRRARFNDPAGVAISSDGSVVVVDRYNATIRRIAKDGVVSTFAGRGGVTGATDGSGSAARFDSPRRVAVAADGALYVADTGNHAIRRISTTGAVTTLVAPSSERIDPGGLAIEADGHILFTDPRNHVIRRADREGRLSIVAGIPGSSGSSDGPAGTARFNAPEDVAVDAAGNIYVADTGNHTIRRIANGIVTTIAGKAGLAGAVDGNSATARLNRPSGIACDARGNVWIADTANHTIRQLTDGFLETVAGLPGISGSTDGAN